MQKIIEQSLRKHRWYKNPYNIEQDIQELKIDIASDIQKEWKVVGKGEVTITKVGDKDIIDLFDDYLGKEIEIAVRQIDG